MVTNISNIKDYDLEVLIPFLSDFKKGFHLRLLAEIIGTTHRTVSKSLEALEKQGIVYYENIGRNKVYYLNLSNSLTKLYILMVEVYRALKLMSKKFIIQKLYDEIIVGLGEISVILFGSFVKDEEDEHSDIDIVIMCEDNEQIEESLKEFTRRHNRETQVYFFEKKDFEKGLSEGDNMILEIIKDHVVLNNPTVFIDILWRYYK